MSSSKALESLECINARRLVSRAREPEVGLGLQSDCRKLTKNWEKLIVETGLG